MFQILGADCVLCSLKIIPKGSISLLERPAAGDCPNLRAPSAPREGREAAEKKPEEMETACRLTP